ncbi:MAG: hypothetical protein LBQ52_03190 [Helicobacteraceae bacterium]|jgi:hypothetical protein|nr:hypothetical protein [Helicobacteraceae bacterium]
MSGGLKLTLIGLAASVSLFFSGCGGSSSGGGGSVSLDQLLSKFPQIDESGLQITEQAGDKWHSTSLDEINGFETRLLSESFVIGNPPSYLTNSCEEFDADDFYKQNAKGDLLACAGLWNLGGGEYEIDVALVSLDGSHTPTDSDISDVFGGINGRAAVAVRSITYQASSYSQAQEKLDAYIVSLQNAGFECGYEYCFKESGDQILEAEGYVSGNVISVRLWWFID